MCNESQLQRGGLDPKRDMSVHQNYELVRTGAVSTLLGRAVVVRVQPTNRSYCTQAKTWGIKLKLLVATGGENLLKK
jgi:hypothetical protein